LTSDGDLALGLTSPSKRLHVYDTTSGIARLETNQTYSDVELKTNNGTAYVSARDGHVLLNRTGGNNVGIGTDSPASKLDVRGTVQVGVDGTGHDVTFYGDTSGEYLQWDASQEKLKFRDNVEANFGNSGDARIYHGFSFFVDNFNGNLVFTQNADGGDIIFNCDNGTGGTTSYITLDGSQTTINLQKTVLIGTTTNTGAYKIDVAGKQRVQDTLELDDVLMLNAISTPADPAASKSVIYMDSTDGGIKCKINVGGTVVTRTLASFE